MALFTSEVTHNDYLQLAFEFGIGSLAIFAIGAFALARTESPDWLAFFTFAIAAGFFFPLYAPMLAFIGCVSAGHLLRGHDPIRAFSDRCRPHIVRWADYL